MKNPTAVWRWGPIKLVKQSEPNRRAAQQQRVQPQVQIQIAVHLENLAVKFRNVKCFSRLRPAVTCLKN